MSKADKLKFRQLLGAQGRRSIYIPMPRKFEICQLCGFHSVKWPWMFCTDCCDYMDSPND